MSATQVSLTWLVERRGSPEHATVDDACAFAWTQLISAEHIDL
jgi:hypothetical protein